jgi:hypothetical protein
MTKSKRRKRCYPLGSTHVDKRVWFYQLADGMHIIVQHFDKAGQYVCTAQAKVPWKAVTASLSMHRRVQAERRAAKRRAK